MAKPTPKFHSVTVTATEQITPNMQRITLQGSDINHIQATDAGGYIKILFNQEGGTDLSALGEGERPAMRTYTIRSVNTDECSIDVDFVRHVSSDHSAGFAALWAMNARVGDTLNIGGPGKLQTMYTEADWYLMVADMTALPACSVKLRQLPESATGYAVLQVKSEQDRQSIEVPEGIKIIWLTEDESITETVKALPWQDDEVSVWSACEFEDMRALRQYFRKEKQVPRQHSYISSYWKRGVSEDTHKVLKKEEADRAD